MTPPPSRRCLFAITGAYHSSGGIAALNRLAIQSLAGRGFDIDLFALSEQPQPASPAEAGIQARVFAGNKIAFALAVWMAILRRQYDYILFDHVNLAAILAPFGWLKRARYTVWLCGIEVFPPAPSLEGRLGLLGAWKRLAISAFTRDTVSRNFPHLAIQVCDLALDPLRHPQPRLSPAPVPALQLTAVNGVTAALEDRAILHVARMSAAEQYKGQDILISALPALLEKHPRTQLVLAGDGDDRPRLLELARTLPPAAQARIFFTGFATDEQLDALYQACFVFAMPSWREGFGLTYLEAMSHGKACLGGRMDATPCVVRNGQTGLLVDDPRSPAQVSAALTWLFDHPAETNEMGQRGIEMVRSYYLLPHFSERLAQALEA